MVTELERASALEAVQAASAMCAAAQGRLVAGDTLTKGDESPVTVADFAAQAVVVASLTERLGIVELVGEEDPDDLASADRSTLRDGVVSLVAGQLGRQIADQQVLDWIGAGGSDGTTGRYWTLDPIDGTKGFLRGDQYAIALALIEDGEVVLGALGCPNLPGADGSTGAVFLTTDSGTDADPTAGSVGHPVRVAEPASLAVARFCESVESGHSDHDQSARIVERLGIAVEPFRIDSQCKYAAVARNDASIYLRLPTRADYQEKIWDHAAGSIIVECAGGRVSDADGKPLDFTCGPTLARNSGVVATCGSIHDEVIASVVRVRAAS